MSSVSSSSSSSSSSLTALEESVGLSVSAVLGGLFGLAHSWSRDAMAPLLFFPLVDPASGKRDKTYMLIVDAKLREIRFVRKDKVSKRIPLGKVAGLHINGDDPRVFGLYLHGLPPFELRTAHAQDTKDISYVIKHVMDPKFAAFKFPALIYHAAVVHVHATMLWHKRVVCVTRGRLLVYDPSSVNKKGQSHATSVADTHQPVIDSAQRPAAVYSLHNAQLRHGLALANVPGFIDCTSLANMHAAGQALAALPAVWNRAPLEIAIHFADDGSSVRLRTTSLRETVRLIHAIQVQSVQTYTASQLFGKIKKRRRQRAVMKQHQRHLSLDGSASIASAAATTATSTSTPTSSPSPSASWKRTISVNTATANATTLGSRSPGVSPRSGGRRSPRGVSKRIILKVRYLGADRPIGFVTLKPKDSVATARQRIVEELDDLPPAFYFLYRGARLAEEEETRVAASDLGSIVDIKPARATATTTSAAVTTYEVRQLLSDQPKGSGYGEEDWKLFESTLLGKLDVPEDMQAMNNVRTLMDQEIPDVPAKYLFMRHGVPLGRRVEPYRQASSVAEHGVVFILALVPARAKKGANKTSSKSPKSPLSPSSPSSSQRNKKHVITVESLARVPERFKSPKHQHKSSLSASSSQSATASKRGHGLVAPKRRHRRAKSAEIDLDEVFVRSLSIGSPRSLSSAAASSASSSSSSATNTSSSSSITKESSTAKSAVSAHRGQLQRSKHARGGSNVRGSADLITLAAQDSVISKQGAELRLDDDDSDADDDDDDDDDDSKKMKTKNMSTTTKVIDDEKEKDKNKDTNKGDGDHNEPATAKKKERSVKEIFLYIKKHVSPNEIVLRSRLPTMEQWRAESAASKLSSRGRLTRAVDRALAMYLSAVFATTTMITQSRLVCTESANLANQSQIGFGYPGFGSQRFEVGEFAVVQSSRLFTSSGVHAFSSDDWRGAVRSASISKELMQSSPDVTDLFMNGRSKEAKRITIDSTLEVLHNLVIAQWYRAHHAVICDGDRVPFKDIVEHAGSTPMPDVNKEHLGVWRGVTYMFNPLESHLAPVLNALEQHHVGLHRSTSVALRQSLSSLHHGHGSLRSTSGGDDGVGSTSSLFGDSDRDSAADNSADKDGSDGAASHSQADESSSSSVSRQHSASDLRWIDEATTGHERIMCTPRRWLRLLRVVMLHRHAQLEYLLSAVRVWLMENRDTQNKRTAAFSHLMDLVRHELKQLSAFLDQLVF